MKKILLIGGLALLSPIAAYANGGATCASPTTLASMSSDGTGDTCGGEVGINMGGAIYPHPSRVYSFHVNHAGPGGTPTTISMTGTNREASVTSSCTSAPVAVAAPGLDVDVNALADGDWLLIVSTDPSLPVTTPPTCGAYTVTAGVLPVALQNFTVE
jgi:hypothetical protein